MKNYLKYAFTFGIIKKAVILIFLFSNYSYGQESLTELKPYEELSKEELYQIGEIAAIESFKDDFSNRVLGFFFGSIAMDWVASEKALSASDSKYKRWTKDLDINKQIINDDMFIEGFFSKRKEQLTASYRGGRVIARVVSVVVAALVLPDIVEDM